MLTKVVTGLMASGLLLAGQTALAGDHGNHYGHGKKWQNRPASDYAYARVVDVDPIVHRVRISTPQRECWTETRYEEVTYTERTGPRRGSAGQMILGGIIGAAIGNQIGSGDGRRAATVAGAVIGSAIGHDVADRRSGARNERVVTESRPYETERCEVRYDEQFEERIEGYRVTYVYNGIQQTTQLPYDPGDRIRVRVDVHPEG